MRTRRAQRQNQLRIALVAAVILAAIIVSALLSSPPWTPSPQDGTAALPE